MSEFTSWQSYWRFSLATRTHVRYLHDDETLRFLETVLATSATRVRTVARGTLLWRAQLGCTQRRVCSEEDYYSEDFPFPPERMKPQLGLVAEGRANPKGIPFLYLSDDKDTALAEVRPSIGCTISAAQFKVLKDLRVVDCSVSANSFFVHVEEDEPAPEEREQAVWADIDTAFSQLVAREDQHTDYVPTQIIAEQFKRNGYDGIIYKSSVGQGRNVALFDLGSAAVDVCCLYVLRRLSHDFEEMPGCYNV